MEYRIQVTEKLQHIETVSAASETEAVELVRQSYKEEKIVLSSEHFSDVAFAVEHQKVQAYYKSPNHDFVLAHGDCFELLRAFDFKFDMIFAPTRPIFSPMAASRCRAARWCVWIRDRGTRGSRKPT